MGGGDHWRWALMDGVDDLGVVDPAQVDRGDGEIGMPELGLDNEQRHPLARHLDRVRVAQLMRRKTPPDTGVGGGVVQLRADAGGRPRAAGGRAAQYAEQRADRECGAQLQLWAQLLPCPAVHSDLAALATFATAGQDRAAIHVKVALGQRERFADAQSGAPGHDDQGA